jgi:hypothetical protein
MPDVPAPEHVRSVVDFAGPVQNIYTTLVVRLARSGIFDAHELWRNGAAFSGLGGRCGLVIREVSEGQGSLSLFFDESTSAETEAQFGNFVDVHLMRRAQPGSVATKEMSRCSECGFAVTDQLFRLRAQGGFDWVLCPNCQERIQLGRKNLGETEDAVPMMDRAADAGRDADVAESTLRAKEVTNDFDVLLAYNHEDLVPVASIAGELRRRGLLPWFDLEQVPPGRSFQSLIQDAIGHVRAAAVVFGKSGLGRWQRIELEAAIGEFINADIPVIAVLLPGVDKPPPELRFLRQLRWVSFADELDAHALDQLEWGIRGDR